jgi:hypothetical protein
MAIKLDPSRRTELTGPWAGFGFQGDHMWTPEGYSLEPTDMRWWSLTCNIAREWRLMMAEERGRVPMRRSGNVIYLRDRLREKQFRSGWRQRDADGPREHR